jgi:hypothetical protein
MGRKADHSDRSSTEIRNKWSYISNPSYIFVSWCLIKRRDKFIISFIVFQYLTPGVEQSEYIWDVS